MAGPHRLIEGPDRGPFPPPSIGGTSATAQQADKLRPLRPAPRLPDRRSPLHHSTGRPPRITRLRGALRMLDRPCRPRLVRPCGCSRPDNSNRPTASPCSATQWARPSDQILNRRGPPTTRPAAPSPTARQTGPYRLLDRKDHSINSTAAPLRPVDKPRRHRLLARPDILRQLDTPYCSGYSPGPAPHRPFDKPGHTGYPTERDHSISSTGPAAPANRQAAPAPAARQAGPHRLLDGPPPPGGSTAEPFPPLDLQTLSTTRPAPATAQ